jgi:peroxiredoxin family protein
MTTAFQTQIELDDISDLLQQNDAKSASSDSMEIIDSLTRRIEALEKTAANAPDANAMNLLVFEGSRDRLLAAFVMATGAAACGFSVQMFFTFWGTAALKKAGPQFGKKTLVERAFGWMLPCGVRSTKLSHMDMFGIGRALMNREMKTKNVADLDELISTAADLSVKISVCEMSMKLMGIRREKLIDYPGLSYCGVATFADLAGRANTTLFI